MLETRFLLSRMRRWSGRPLSPGVTVMNEIKETGETLEALVSRLRAIEDIGPIGFQSIQLVPKSIRTVFWRSCVYFLGVQVPPAASIIGGRGLGPVEPDFDPLRVLSRGSLISVYAALLSTSPG